jgi:cephalosporin-C deacetylase-like acetyl esterase
MIEPDDFGFSPIATLAHVGEPTRSIRHGSFWKTWTAGVMADRPRLVARDHASSDPSDPSATHEFESCRHARIGCSFLPPRGRPRAGLIVLHGYENVPSLAQSADDWQSFTDRGLAILIIRARGYAGSCADVPQLVHHAGHKGGGDWITYGLEVPMSDRGYGCDWSFSYAAADVVNACRALRLKLGEPAGRVPIFMHGESFGAALAVIAASQLADLDEPARLVIGLPTMGDWAWRLALPENASAGGAGGRIRRFMLDHPNLRADVSTTLRVFDAAVHARRITCPVLCKLAVRDEIVPAPAAAAVFNALGSDPGLKWRFVTHYGHFDGGLADLRRHALFEKVAADFLDPGINPDAAMSQWEGVMTSGVNT